MLNEKEINQLRKNAIIHKKVFEEIKKVVKDWTTAVEINKLAWDICKENWVLAWFKWVYWFPSNLCISVNDVVVHWIARKEIIFRDWDLVTFDFWVKDKNYWVNTDSAISLIIWWAEKNPEWQRLIEANIKALYAWIFKARAWNRVWDIWSAIQKEIEWAWYHVVRELSGHGVWKELHEKPYIYNYWNPGIWSILVKWMTLAIEPILWQKTWKIRDEWSWEIYIEDWSLWCQYEHTILITDWEAEIII